MITALSVSEEFHLSFELIKIIYILLNTLILSLLNVVVVSYHHFKMYYTQLQLIKQLFFKLLSCYIIVFFIFFFTVLSFLSLIIKISSSKKNLIFLFFIYYKLHLKHLCRHSRRQDILSAYWCNRGQTQKSIF